MPGKRNPSGTVTKIQGPGHGTAKSNGTGMGQRNAPLAKPSGGGKGVIPKKDKPVGK
jgi:hypothetical protein